MIHRIAIFLLLLRCIAPCVYASDAEDLYRKHITNIEPNSVTQLEGYLFSSASFIPSSQSSPAITGALKRAHFQAKIQILIRYFPGNITLKVLVWMKA
jgi:hypothetical protein